jgi:hypothetical protein
LGARESRLGYKGVCAFWSPIWSANLFGLEEMERNPVGHPQSGRFDGRRGHFSRALKGSVSNAQLKE